MRPGFVLVGKAIRENLDGDEDPQGHQKDSAERQWQTVLLQFWRGQLERIEKKLEPGIPKSRKAIEDLPKRLDKSFWDSENRLLLAEILPLLSDGATEAAKLMAEAIEAQYGIGVDWTLINTAAATWARVRAGELIKGWKKPDGSKAPGLNERTKKATREAIAQFIETPGRTMGDLRRDLAKLPAFGDNRAGMIAVTEVTGSYAGGTAAAYQEYGFPPIAYNPPAHPRGRCWTTAALLPSGEWVIVWQTNKDIHVCKIPLATPWGQVMGCSALQGVIVSEGRWLGQKLTTAMKGSRA